MKATGIIRRIDHLGRLVIPKSIRNRNGWREGTPVEIYVEDGKVILQTCFPQTVEGIETLKHALEKSMGFEAGEANNHLNRALSEIDAAIGYLRGTGCRKSGKSGESGEIGCVTIQ